MALKLEDVHQMAANLGWSIQKSKGRGLPMHDVYDQHGNHLGRFILGALRKFVTDASNG